MAIINLNDTTPAAPAGKTNCKWQADSSAPRNVSVYMPNMVGDSGSGGESGAVPAPGAGDAAAGKFLKADGTWASVPGLSKYATSWTLQTSVTVTHNLGTIAIIVQVFDANSILVQPESIAITSANVVTLTFGAAFTGSVVVLG